jgi:hypothetical protein
VKVVVVLLFVMHPSALHLKLMLVQKILQQNVVMCLTLTPWKTKKKGVKEWEINRVFQNVWAMKLPWVEAMFGADGK